MPFAPWEFTPESATWVSSIPFGTSAIPFISAIASVLAHFICVVSPTILFWVLTIGSSSCTLISFAAYRFRIFCSSTPAWSRITSTLALDIFFPSSPSAILSACFNSLSSTLGPISIEVYFHVTNEVFATTYLFIRIICFSTPSFSPTSASALIVIICVYLSIIISTTAIISIFSCSISIAIYFSSTFSRLVPSTPSYLISFSFSGLIESFS